MRSKTLSSDLTVFKKDLTRFSPLWITWSVFLLINCYLIYSNGLDPSDRYDVFPTEILIANILLGFCSPVMLFGYLFDPKECFTTHSLPIRRERLFLSHLLSGVVMYLVPWTLYCLAIAPACKNGLLPMFVLSGLQFLFFYGLGIFCVMLTGQKFSAAIMYGLLNFGSILVYLTAEVIYMPLLPGVTLSMDPFVRLCPPAAMMFRTSVHSWLAQDLIPYSRNILLFAAVGVGLLVASVFLYRSRKLERAENFMAYPALNYLFVVLCTVFSGWFFTIFSSLFSASNYWVMLAIGCIIGYFASVMLLKHSPKVFYGKALAGFALIGVVMVGSILMVKADPMGYVHYMPEPQSITRMELSRDEYDHRTYFTEDPAMFEGLMQLHRELMDQPPYDQTDGSYGTRSVQITYQLNSGKTVKRYYSAQQPNFERLSWYMSQPEYRFGFQSLSELQHAIAHIELTVYFPQSSQSEQHYTFRPEQYNEFAAILFDDCKAGNMTDNAFRGFSDDTSETIERVYGIQLAMKGNGSEHPEDYDYVYLEIPKSAAATCAWLDHYIDTFEPDR